MNPTGKGMDESELMCLPAAGNSSLSTILVRRYRRESPKSSTLSPNTSKEKDSGQTSRQAGILLKNRPASNTNVN